MEIWGHAVQKLRGSFFMVARIILLAEGLGWFVVAFFRKGILGLPGQGQHRLKAVLDSEFIRAVDQRNEQRGTVQP